MLIGVHKVLLTKIQVTPYKNLLTNLIKTYKHLEKPSAKPATTYRPGQYQWFLTTTSTATITTPGPSKPALRPPTPPPAPRHHHDYYCPGREVVAGFAPGFSKVFIGFIRVLLWFLWGFTRICPTSKTLQNPSKQLVKPMKALKNPGTNPATTSRPGQYDYSDFPFLPPPARREA